MAELGAGAFLKGTKPKELKKAVDDVLIHPSYQQKAQKMSDTFKKAGGAAEAARVILAVTGEKA